MLIEAAVGVSLGWLWGKLADVAESKDDEKAIKKALTESIEQSYKQFQNKHKELSKSFFNEEFLEQHVCPEILKLLTRNLSPDIASVSNAFPNYVVLASENEFQEEIREFFALVIESMKSHEILQEIIDRRQIEETSQTTKAIQKEQKTNSKLIVKGFEEISLEHEHIDTKINQFSSQIAEQHIVEINALNSIKASLPDSKGLELNKLVTDQLDRARDLIKEARTNDAFDLLKSLETSVSTSDNYTRFRWHTNIGTCYLFRDQIDEAVEQYLTAYNFAKNEEKAVANRIRSYLLINKLDYGLKESEKALNTFPESGIIWALHIKAKQLLSDSFDCTLLPDELQNDSSILLMLADIRLTEKSFKNSFNLARKAFEQDESSIDAKRAMLISAISWITIDTVKAYYKQIGTTQYEALEYAVDSFKDIIVFLRNIQSKSIFIEIAHNLATATELLSDKNTKRIITSYAFSLYPGEYAFIGYKIKEFEEAGDIDSIRKLTHNILNDLEKPILFLLAEISANEGELEWNEKILKFLENKTLENREPNELIGLKICARWRSGNKTQAMSLAKENLSQIEKSPLLLSFYIRMVDEFGEHEERDRLLLSHSNLPDNSLSLDILQFADLLYDFSKYYDAANLYSRLIELPVNDYLTKRYLDSLIKSDQRAKAVAVLDKLPKKIREQSSFRRAEANLARATGDLDTLENLLEQELQLFPADSYVAAGYIATLYRKNKMEDLYNYLAQNPLFEPIIEANEIEIAKYQVELGLEYEAILRIYTLFRLHPNSSEIAGYYFLSLFYAKQSDTFKAIEKVASGTAVYLESDKYKKVVVIEPKHLSTTRGWPECTSEDSELANKLTDHHIGDLVEITIGIETNKAKIIDIKSMFVFALNNAHKVIADSASSAGPVWSVNVKKLNGEFDFNSISKLSKSRHQQAERVFNTYEKNKVPLQIIANALGIDIITLLLQWPYDQYDLFVGTGIHEEMEKVKELINKGGKPYVIDITGIVELNRLGLLVKSLGILGKPLVTTSLREQLLGLIQIQTKTSPDSTANEISGKKKLLNTLLQFVDDHCEVTPVIGPPVVTEQQTSIGEFLDYPSHDAIYLALERNAMLISEDGGFRSLAEGIGVTSSTWLQPLLLVLRDREIISEDQYSSHVLDKLNRHHDFTSIAAIDLLWAAKSSPNSISPIVESAIQTFKKSSLDLISGIYVGSKFLQLAARHINPDTLYQYYQLILDSLSFERDIYSDGIHESLRVHIVSSLTKIKPKKANLIIHKFGDKLAEPKPSPIRLKPLTHAVNRALHKWHDN